MNRTLTLRDGVLQLPEELLAEAGLTPDSDVVVRPNNGGLIITPVPTPPDFDRRLRAEGVTDADLAQVRARLTRPRPELVVKVLALAEKLAGKLDSIPEVDRRHHLLATLEALRAEAIADGTAILDEAKVVLDD
jgi:antitoxin component of MazEF toxin-antitoxin module